ncbi:dihydrodipicolinate synthase family protein [Roseomonas sp. BN140053]|uniref:dihydrodipicolinate synthase family protein n=1 Tax=Roseomonas sp. BN140053 TaxID=3391898 RepID=UPI0039ECBA43
MASSEQKQWAREHYKGVEDSLKTAFTPDFSALDEDGIRHDVRNSIRNGFFAAMCSCTYTTMPEKKQFLEIAADEGRGKILIGINAAIHDLEAGIELMQHGEKVGCTHAFIEYPRHLQPESPDEVYRYLRQLTDATRLPIILYGYHAPALRRFHPSGIVMEVLDRLAEVPNVVGMKFTQVINPASAFEMAERLGDRILFGPANLTLVPPLARHHHVQWLGQWVVESLQSPEKPYLTEFMQLVNAGRLEAAMTPYWQMIPAYNYVHELQRSYLLRGSHPWAHINYYHWCVGGNGGLPRGSSKNSDAVAVLDAKGREEIREQYRKIGIPTTEAPEEEFVVGKANYAKGIRMKDLSRTPLYA